MSYLHKKYFKYLEKVALNRLFKMEENVDALMDTFMSQIRKMLATGTFYYFEFLTKEA